MLKNLFRVLRYVYIYIYIYIYIYGFFMTSYALNFFYFLSKKENNKQILFNEKLIPEKKKNMQ